MSVIEAEIEVDETDIPFVRDRPAGEGHDRRAAGPDVHRQGDRGRQQPDRGTGAAATTRATNFKVVVTLDGEVPDVRPGFTCTAVITTATRQKVLGVPIQAMTRPRADRRRRRARSCAAGRAGAAARRHAGRPRRRRNSSRARRARKSRACSSSRDGHAVFVPVKTGIAGEKYFEVLDGLKEGDEVITGPFASVRTLQGRRRGQGRRPRRRRHAGSDRAS